MANYPIIEVGISNQAEEELCRRNVSVNVNQMLLESTLHELGEPRLDDSLPLDIFLGLVGEKSFWTKISGEARLVENTQGELVKREVIIPLFNRHLIPGKLKLRDQDDINRTLVHELKHAVQFNDNVVMGTALAENQIMDNKLENIKRKTKLAQYGLAIGGIALGAYGVAEGDYLYIALGSSWGIGAATAPGLVNLYRAAETMSSQLEISARESEKKVPQIISFHN